MTILSRVRALLRDTSGNALAIGAAALPLVIGGAGLALDTVQISLAKRELQRAADSGALAGAHAVLQTFSARDAVDRDLQLNNDVPLSAPATVENAPTTGPYAGNPRAVRVVLTADRTLSFLSFFNPTPQRITVDATAAGVVAGEFCMLALEEGNITNVSLGGNTTVDIGCGISSNSSSTAAISATGSSTVRATPIMAVGNIPSSSNYATGTEIIPFAAPQQDPYSSLPLPAPTNCQPKHTVGPNQTATISPGADGTACFNGIDIKGTVTFQPGIYYINGDALDFGSQARVSGSGVTFVLTSTNAVSNPSSIATMNLNGGAQMNLSSPATGPYRGVLFYEDPRAPVGRTIRFNGNSNSVIEGGFYFSRAYFEFNGTTGMQTRCIQLVARRLSFTGNSRIENACPEGGGARAFQGTFVRLVA